MMPVPGIINIVAPIIIISAIGFIFGKLKRIELKTLADYIIYISGPSLALAQLSMQRLDLLETSSIVLTAAFVILGSGAAALVLFKLCRFKASAGIYLPIMFMNTSFIGFPLALFAFGEAGLNKAIIYDMANALLIFSLGIYIVSRSKNRWQVLKIPYIYAALTGIILSLSGLRIPQSIFTPLYLLGTTTIPLALFLLGCHLASVKISSWRLPLAASGIRLLFGFGLGLLAVYAFKLHGIAAKISVLASSLPSAITTIALAEEYDASPETVASTIALSTLLSILTAFIILSWLGGLTI